MIIPDLNVLLHAYNTQAKEHPAAKKWWAGALTDQTRFPKLRWFNPIGVC